tara:strand:- start:93 stop:1241 length:1149 start_codon:yes stop_codon:yes gene_type:complete
MGLTKIGTDSIKDNAVTSAKIPANAVTQSEVNFPVANRNKLINGSMIVSARGTSITTGDNAEHYTMDRWAIYCQNTNSRFTVTQSTDTPDGFGNSLKIDCTTADTSLASNEEVQFYQKVEGFNTQDFAKGTSAAKQYTLSFYVKTNKTGTYVVNLLGRDNTTSDVAATYTVSDTNWNRYTITFPADTNSNRADNNDNGEALRVVWWLVAGSAVQSGDLGTTWANNSDAGRATGQVNFADSTSNDWYITGCQLEVGSVATDFEHRSFGQELALCQRYFEKSFKQGTAPAQNVSAGVGYYLLHSQGSQLRSSNIHFKVTKRTDPTMTYFNPYAANANARLPFSSTDLAGIATNSISDNWFSFDSTDNTPSPTLAHLMWTASAEL